MAEVTEGAPHKRFLLVWGHIHRQPAPDLGDERRMVGGEKVPGRLLRRTAQSQERTLITAFGVVGVSSMLASTMSSSGDRQFSEVGP